MKRSLKALLTLALAAFTGYTWATTYSSLPSYTITSANYATLTSPVLMPETAVDSFTVTIMFTGGTQRSDISQVKLIDPEMDTQVAVDTHDGFSGGNKQNHVYTLSNIPAEYAGKVLLVKSTVKCNEPGGSSTCEIQLSNGVTHTDYTDITEVIAINFASDKKALDTTAEGNLGFVTADGVQGAQVALAKWNNASGGNSAFEHTITVAGAKTEKTYSLTYSAPNSWDSKAENTFNTPIGNLTKGYLDVSNHGAGVPNISLAGMPTTGYDVAVILSGDGGTFGAVTVNGKDYIGANGKTIAGAAAWSTRQSFDSLAEGQNVVFVTEQSAETLIIKGNATTSEARASIAGLMVFFRKIPPTLACTYTVTDEGGSWDVAPSTEKPCVATIAFGETTGKSVDLATILGDVKSLKSLTITGTNGGTIANTDGVTAAGVNINTNVKISSSFATPAVTTIGDGASAYFTGETTASTAPFPYSGNRHFETIKFTIQQMGSGIENYTIATNEQMLFTFANVRYIENLILDGGLLKTQGNGQAWFGGAANKCLTVKSGIADLTSITTDNGSSAVLIGYSGNGHTLDIQGGLLDASNTSIVGWELNSKYSQSGGLVKTKGFRQNGDRITEMTLTGGTIELGAGGIPNLGMANATLGAATIRATADATIAEDLNVTGAATLQAVDGKMLTVSGTISGDGTIAIGGTGTTKTRADDGTYTDATVNATGTVYIGTNRPKIASIAEGATLQIALTDDEVANGISWNVGENLTTDEANRLTVVGATLDNITVTDGVLTARLASNLAASWENGVWSKTPVDGAPITITFSDGYTTCTFTNTEAIELASLTIKGETAGEIVLGEHAVTVSEMTVEPTEVTIPVALFNSFDAQAYTVESGKTLKLTGDAEVSKKVDVRGTLALVGSMNFTAGNYVYNGGKLDVVSGETTFNTGNDRGFQDGSTIKIAKGATLKNGKADAPGYNNVTLDIAGTLEVTNGVRWSLGATSSTTLHEGAVLKGTGENDEHNEYAFDYFNGATITVDGDAKIEGNIGAHDGGKIIFNVTSGKTLTIEGAVKAGPLATSGEGTVKLAGANTHANTSIANDSKLVVTHASALGSGNITLDGALTFKDVEATLGNAITQTDPENTTNPTGQIVIDNSTVTLNGANGDYKGSITINEGAMLKSVTFNYAPFGNGASIVNNGAIDVTNTGAGDCAISAAISGSGSLTVNAGTFILGGANTYRGTTTIAEGAKVVAQTANGATWNFNNVSTEADVTVDGTLDFVSTSEIYRGFAGTGTINIKGNVILGNTGNSGELSGLSRFTGNLVVDASKTLTLITWGNPYNIAVASLELNGTIAGQAKGGNASTLSLTTQSLSGTGTINVPVTLADGATLNGAVTVNANVTVAGALTITHATQADDVVIICNNAADILASMPAKEGLNYVADGNTIKLAVATITVTLPPAPDGTYWYYGDAEVVGSIEGVDPATGLTLTLKTEEGYVFADGSTSKEVTVAAGETSATLPADSTPAAGVAKIGNKLYTSFATAFAAAQADETITLLAGVTINSRLDIAQNVTIDLNGQTIAETMEDQFGAIYVKKGATLTIEATNGGEITTNGGIVIGNYGTVVVNGGTIAAGEEPEADVSIYNFYYQADWYGTTTVNGGTVARIWNCGVATLAGGTVTDVDNSGAMEIAEEATVTNVLLRDGTDASGIEGAGTLTAAEGLTVTTEDGQVVVYADGKYTVVEAKAEINGTPYTTFAVAFDAAQAGDTITLLADVTITSRLNIAQDVTIDLNGNTIAETMEDSYGAIYVKKGATLTIAATNGGEITTDGGIVIGNYGTVIVNGGTIAAGEEPEADVSVYNFYYQANYYGTTTINGGTVARIWNCGVATLAGGEVTDVDNSGAMTITGATVANIILRDGTDAPGIEGAGTLTAAEGLTVTTEDGQKAVYADGKYTVVDIVYVAQVGEAKYATLQAAIAAGTEVTVIADIATDAAIEVTKQVKINLNGKTIKTTEADTEGNGVFWVKNGGDLTLNGEGTINGVGGNIYNIAIWADGGKVTINGGTYTNEGAQDNGPDGAHFDLIYVKHSGSIEINGGTFKCQTPAWTLNSHDEETGTIFVKGGNFKGFNPANCATEGPNTNWCVEGYVAVVGKDDDADYYIVKQSTISGDIIVDNTESGEKLTTEAVTVLEQIAADNNVTITKVEAVTEAQAEALNEALQVFEEIVEVEASVATVDWNFGIADITRNGNNVVITAKVTKGEVTDPAAFADGVKVIFTVGTKVYEVEPSNDDDGVATVTIPLADIEGEISVKASKE